MVLNTLNSMNTTNESNDRNSPGTYSMLIVHFSFSSY